MKAIEAIDDSGVRDAFLSMSDYTNSNFVGIIVENIRSGSATGKYLHCLKTNSPEQLAQYRSEAYRVSYMEKAEKAKVIYCPVRTGEFYDFEGECQLCKSREGDGLNNP